MSLYVIQLINCALLSPKKLTVRDEQPTKLCGKTSPGLIVTNSNMVKLEYHIDDEGQSNGWSLDYSTHSNMSSSNCSSPGCPSGFKSQCKIYVWLFLLFPGMKCPSPGSVAKGRVTPNLSEYLFRDYIYVRCDQGYKLMMVSWNCAF